MDDQNAGSQPVAPGTPPPSSGGDDVIHQLEEELHDMGVHAPDTTVMPDPVHAPAAQTTASAATPVLPAQSTLVTDPLVVPQTAAAPTSVASPAARVETPAPIPAVFTPAPSPAVAADTSAVPLSDMPIHNEAMGQVLTNAIQKGKDEVPHAPDPLVSKPGELESWRVFKIMSEFVEGFEILRKYGLAASIFGSARETFAKHFYDDATELAGKLAKGGFAIITGGSAGIMEAANKGAFEAGGASVGLNIRLDASQGMNEYLTDSMTFEHFFVRKVMLTFASEVYIYFPGGFGTLDEFTEIITLVQTGKIRKIPIVLYGREYWEPFTKVFDERLNKAYDAIDAADMDLYRVVDSVDEAYEYIMQATGGKDTR